MKIRNFIAWACFGAGVLCVSQAAEVKTVAIHSAKMGRDIPATLILPDAYAAHPERRFPVLYLLHGAGDTHKKWNQETDIAALADQYGMIVLCPDGGKTSWFFDSPIDPKFQYETFVAKECVEFMDKNYRTLVDRRHRALCGNSMGGHGALFLAIRHKDTFATAVALSGGVDIRPFARKWSISRRIGSKKKFPENWEKLTVINLAKSLKPGDLAISLDCGDHDFFLKVNRALHEQLLAQGIDHQYQEHPGSHGWDYWRKAIKRQMPFIEEQFRENRRSDRSDKSD